MLDIQIKKSDNPGAEYWMIFMREQSSDGYRLSKTDLRELYKLLRRDFPEFKMEDAALDLEESLKGKTNN